MASASERVNQRLPQDYKRLRSFPNIRAIWLPIIEDELRQYWAAIAESIQAFQRANTELRQHIIANFEPEDNAEAIVSEVMNDRFPGALQLLEDLCPNVAQYLTGPSDSPPAGNEVQVISDSRRSVTMMPDPSTRDPPAGSGGVAPTAPMTPVSPLDTRGNVVRNGKGAISAYDDFPTSDVAPSAQPPPDPCPSSTTQPTNKRAYANINTSADNGEGSSRGAAAKRKKTGVEPTVRVTKTIGFWDVEGTDYVFEDKRFGPGWFVIRCNLSAIEGVNGPFRFTRHPISTGDALSHFRDSDRTCHDSGGRPYDMARIMMEHGHRGK